MDENCYGVLLHLIQSLTRIKVLHNLGSVTQKCDVIPFKNVRFSNTLRMWFPLNTRPSPIPLSLYNTISTMGKLFFVQERTYNHTKVWPSGCLKIYMQLQNNKSTIVRKIIVLSIFEKLSLFEILLPRKGATPPR